MKALLAGLLIAAVPVGGSFGDAEATTVSLTETSVVIDLTVEVPEETQAVIVHIGLTGENMRFPMVPRATPGLWGLQTELERKNWQIVFEILGPDSELSQPMTIAFLGAELNLETDPGPDDPDEGISRETRRWGWLGLALAAASLSLLAFWVLGGKDDESEDGNEEE